MYSIFAQKVLMELQRLRISSWIRFIALSTILTKGSLYLSHQLGARWGTVACGVVCRGYHVGVIIGEAEPSCPTGIVD